MAVNQNIPILFENPLLPVVGNTAFGYYDSDSEFQSDCLRFVKFAASQLGWPISSLEIQDVQMYIAFESAINTYGKELYEYKIRENYLSLEGSPTGSINLNNTVVQPNLGTIIRIAKNYGTEAGTGGNVNYYTGSIACNFGQQEYDLDMWASASGVVQPGDSIEVKRVFYEIPPAVNRAFSPLYGAGYQDLLSSFGVDNSSEGFGVPAINYNMFPVYADVLRIQAVEFNDQIRRSAYTFELHNNKLRIFPIPAFNRTILFHYIKQSERNNPAYMVNGSAPQGLVTNVGNIRYDVPVYSQINKVFRKWIMEYALAICKEVLGNIRGKYTTVEIPGEGSSVTLNGSSLLEQSVNEKLSLITQLRDTLDNSSRSKQLAMQAEQAASLNIIQNNVPMLIYIG